MTISPPLFLLVASLLCAVSPAPSASEDGPPPPRTHGPQASPVAPAPHIDPAAVETALATLPPGPSLVELQAAALERAQIDVAFAARWLRRARLAALAPTLSVQYDHRLDRGWVLDQAPGQADALRDDAGQQGLVRAKLSWELDRLIFNPDELRAARALLDLAELRERVLIHVTQLYFERQRLLVETRLQTPAALADPIATALRIRELEGLLSALTGLSFTPPRPAEHR